jgi:aspartate kinase
METQVFKCGGKFFISSIVKSFFNQTSINLKDKKTVFVISAMNGITRLLRLIFIIKTEVKIDEELKKLMTSLCLSEFKRSHMEFIVELFPEEEKYAVENNFIKLFNDLEKTIDVYKTDDNKDEFYASVLQFGELASSSILSSYINYIKINNTWFDAREYVVTDSNCREARILNIKEDFQNLFEKDNVLVTQGFIGRDAGGSNTVVGFDGSDYSASMFANSITKNQKQISLTIWKDVMGVYDENPAKNKEAKLISKMSRGEYIENTEKNGSFVVRPDSISSLNENVEVIIRSFVNFENSGTKIQ